MSKFLFKSKQTHDKFQELANVGRAVINGNKSKNQPKRLFANGYLIEISYQNIKGELGNANFAVEANSYDQAIKVIKEILDKDYNCTLDSVLNSTTTHISTLNPNYEKSIFKT